MANMELDPTFVRGLRLLHSRARDSTDQLRALLDEVRLRSGRAGGKHSPANMSPRSTPTLARADANLKRSVDKVKDDIGDSGVKRARMDSPVAFKSHTPSPTMSRDSDASKKSDDSDLNDTAGLEMDFMDQLACVVCRNMGVGSGNQLIECQECGNLYHQECHRPAITDRQRADTRSVWRCSNCREPVQPTTHAVGSGRSLLKPTAVPGSKLDKNKVDSLSERDGKGASSRLDPSSSGAGSSTTGSSRPAGVSLLKSKATAKSLSSLHLPKTSSGMAASSKSSHTPKPTVGCRSVPGSPSGGKPAGSSSHPPPNSMVSAERRMQLMKKKAAAKLNEKRKN